MKESMRNALVLVIITLVAGFILGGVYELTKDTIAARQEEDKKAAYVSVFNDADNFTAYDGFNADEVRSYLDSNGYASETINEVLVARDTAGNKLGYAFNVTTSEGYGGDITFTVGIKNDGTVNGVSILEINETAGLGMNAEKVLIPQFAGKQVPLFAYTKTGSTSDSEIDAISGATITTNAFVNGVNCCLKYFENIGGGSNE